MKEGIPNAPDFLPQKTDLTAGSAAMREWREGVKSTIAEPFVPNQGPVVLQPPHEHSEFRVQQKRGNLDSPEPK